MILGRAIARYYCRNINAFLFALLRVYGVWNNRAMAAELAGRGIDMKKLRLPAGFRFPEMRGRRLILPWCNWSS
jgi:hypothetical protein